jgi:hypothetical protein
MKTGWSWNRVFRDIAAMYDADGMAVFRDIAAMYDANGMAVVRMFK